MLDYVYIMTKDDTKHHKLKVYFNIVYKREYIDSDEDTDTFLDFISIYKNVPISKIKFTENNYLKLKIY